MDNIFVVAACTASKGRQGRFIRGQTFNHENYPLRYSTVPVPSVGQSPTNCDTEGYTPPNYLYLHVCTPTLLQCFVISVSMDSRLEPSRVYAFSICISVCVFCSCLYEEVINCNVLV